MSRAYNARRKAKRQHSRIASDDADNAPPTRSRRLIALIPAVAIIAILATVGAVGFGAGNGIDRKQVRQEVTKLLAGIPQHGTTLGSPEAPIAIRVFADLECPTVRSFVDSYLPSIIGMWVREGEVKLEYRSLETDTADEATFFEQERAALAAGRQDRMWNFALTFLHEQGPARTDYATDAFMADIASQVPDLRQAQWRHDREDPLLSKQVAHSLHYAHVKRLQFTPSFLIGVNSVNDGQRTGSNDTEALRAEVESFLNENLNTLAAEASSDVPALGSFEPQERNSKR